MPAFLGYSPDVDPTTPGAMLDCQNMLPTLRGMKAAPSAVSAGMPALPDTVIGASTVVRLDDVKRLFVGTATKLYEEVTGAWEDVTRSNGNYTSSSANVWRFAQFGNVTLATNNADTLQQTLDGNFGDVPQPLSSIALTAGGSGYTSAPTVAFVGGNGSGATATATLTPTSVASANVTAGGTGYTSAPAVSASGGGGTGFAATAVLTGSAVTSINITNHGVGYTSAPTLALSGGAGSGATATAVLTGTSVASLALTAQGNGYNTTPTVSFSGGGGTGASASVVVQKAPVAAIIEVASNFVLLFNTTDPLNGTRPDGWWSSGIGDNTIWTASEATQSAFGRMINTAGDVRAARALGEDVVVYKETSMYYGTYQGPPVIWAFPVISTQIGAPCQEAVVSIGTAHYFLGNDNFYVFDGTRPQPIGDRVKTTFFGDWNPAHQQTIRSVHDRVNSLVFWYYVSNASTGAIDKCIVYNYKMDRWGRADRAIEASVDFINGQITWESLGTIANEWKDLPQVPWDSPFWTSVATQPSVIDTNHTIQTLTGVAGNSSITTGDFGDDESYSLLQYVRLRCVMDPATATMSTQGRSTLGSSPTIGPSSTYEDGKFDVDISDRYHRCQMAFQGDCEIIGYTPKLVPDGEA